MPHPHRNLRPAQLVHVICRFVNGEFRLTCDEERDKYLRILRNALRKSDWVLVAYALMSSHIHLGFVMGAAELRDWALPLHVRFAQWINRKASATNPKVLGHVFADRPTTKVMCRSRAPFLIAYHHRNPIAAGVTNDASASSWTSHRAYRGLARSEGNLDVALGLRLAGYPSSPRGRRLFDRFVQRTAVTLAELGAEPSASDLEGEGQAVSTATAVEIIRSAAAVVGGTVEDVMRGSRKRPVVMVRRVALMAWFEQGGRAAHMAAALGISSGAASRLMSRPHDERTIRAAAEHVLSIAQPAALPKKQGVMLASRSTKSRK